MVLQMHILHVARQDGGNLGERQVVGGDDTDRTVGDQHADQRLGGGASVLRVRAAQQLVEQEQHPARLIQQVANLADAQDLGKESRPSLAQGVGVPQAGAEHQGRDAQARGADRRARKCEDGVEANGAHQRALARHVGAADDENPRA